MGIKGCTICARPDVEAINRDMLAGVTFNALRDKYGAAVGTLHRHSQHLRAQVMKAQALNADTVTGSEASVSESAKTLKMLYERANDLYLESKKAGDRLNAGRAIKELRDILELTMRVSGELNHQTQIIHNHLHVSPEWTQLRAVMLSALQPYPEARQALVEALEGAQMLTGESDA